MAVRREELALCLYHYFSIFFFAVVGGGDLSSYILGLKHFEIFQARCVLRAPDTGAERAVFYFRGGWWGVVIG